MASFDGLEQLLETASRLLDRSAEHVRDLGLDPQKNLRRIGEAIVFASEVRGDICAVRPDLMPDYLRKK